ncbi:methyl-accepting chemotaxis protein [Sulfurospirillum halorespirans]|uniref:Signal transduction histidine-protein kinase n=1 Tax=Sulfurospirillum halorespirans DSM 13726 TaxID=1193502 RepID=A0A1D7TMK3_9BACT|nr:methyl-accepting chemotaxis protein [Sulfurospirillum halorespirans]AOO66228.1 signal transduction histidine-protein kinase [Sulfurospirillum halorespirans DSM 13726]
MKNATLGYRISLGFGVLIAIVLIIGLTGIISMRSASSDATRLSAVYVPEVTLASQVMQNFSNARYNILSFISIDDEVALSKAKTNFADLQANLLKVEELGKKNNLKKLLEHQKAAAKALAEYVTTVEQNEKILVKKKLFDEATVNNAALFLKSVELYRQTQEEQLFKEMNDRISPAELKQRYSKLAKIDDVLSIGTYSRVYGQRAQVKRDPALLESAIKKFDVLFQDVSALKAQTTDSVALGYLNAIESSAKVYEESLKGFVAVMQETNEVQKKRLQVVGELSIAIDAITEEGFNSIVTIAEETSSSLSTASFAMIVGVIVGLIISIILAFFLIRSIVKVVVDSVKSLSEGTAQVVSASEQISSASVSLAEGASSQASSVEEVSATIEEATASNNQNADNSREANLLAQHSNDAARIGNQQVGDLMVAMEKITDSSQKIAKIIKTIDEIAFQTNLLALNAAVEAARAGEHGLGFAVVAEEVKNLAERSAGAAKEITGIIEASIDQVKMGTEVANRTKESFTEILTSIKKTSDLIGEIAISAKEQAEGMNQIATAMGSVDQITQQNASASEETAAAAEELNAQALSMLESVAEIAALAGYDMGKEASKAASLKRASTSSLSMPPKRLAMAPKRTKSTFSSASKRSNEEVFPLDEDDLKEF